MLRTWIPAQSYCRISVKQKFFKKEKNHPLTHVYRTILKVQLGGRERKPLSMFHPMRLLLEFKFFESSTLNTVTYLPFPYFCRPAIPKHPPRNLDIVMSLFTTPHYWGCWVPPPRERNEHPRCTFCKHPFFLLHNRLAAWCSSLFKSPGHQAEVCCWRGCWLCWKVAGPR